MTRVQPITNESVRSESKEPREQHLTQTPIDHILQKLSRMELPAKDHFERYMRHKWRLNHKPRALQSSFTSVMLFLDFYGKSGKRELGEMCFSLTGVFWLDGFDWFMFFPPTFVLKKSVKSRLHPFPTLHYRFI